MRGCVIEGKNTWTKMEPAPPPPLGATQIVSERPLSQLKKLNAGLLGNASKPLGGFGGCAQQQERISQVHPWRNYSHRVGLICACN